MNIPWIKVTVDDNNIQHMSIGVDEVFITFSAPKDATDEQIAILSGFARNADAIFSAALVESSMV